MTRITLDQANVTITAALSKGAGMGLKPLTVAVLDAGGHLLAFQRQDGASTLRPQIAVAKASGALALGVSSRKISDMAAERPTFVTSLGSIASHGLPMGIRCAAQMARRCVCMRLLRGKAMKAVRPAIPVPMQAVLRQLRS